MPRRPRSLLPGLFLLVGAGALAWMIYRIGLGDLLHALADIGWGFALTCSANLVALSLDSVVLRAFAGAVCKDVPFLHFLRASVAGHGINEATPFGKLGEVTKYTILSQRMKPTSAAGALVAQNICSFVVNCGLIGLGAPVALIIFGVDGAMAVAFAVIGGVFLISGVVGLVILQRGIGRWPFAIARRAGIGRFRLSRERVDGWQAGWRKVEETWQEAASDKVAMQTSWIAAISSRLVTVGETALMLYLLGADRILPAAVLSLGASQAVSWTFSFMPMQAGTAEGGAYLVFSAAGLSPEIGVFVEIGRKLRRVVFIALGIAVLGWDTFTQLRHDPPDKPAT